MGERKRKQEPVEVQAVVRTLRIFEALAAEEELGLIELSGRVGLHKSTLYRFMCTLCKMGYVSRNPNTERFSLTLKVFEIGSSVYARIDMVKLASPVMLSLSAATRETVHLAALDEHRLVYLSKIESTRALRVAMSSRVGMTAPAYCTGVGKVLLAWADTPAVQSYVNTCEFVRYTENTVSDRLKLAAELQAIRNRGWAIDDEEHEHGVRCVAAPVRDKSGRVIAALSISGPTIRLEPERLDTCRALVCGAADEISALLGYSKPAVNQTTARSRRRSPVVKGTGW